MRTEFPFNVYAGVVLKGGGSEEIARSKRAGTVYGDSR